MYRGRQFSRQQVVFMIEAALVAALDRIETALPDAITFDEYKAKQPEMDSFIQGCESAASMQIAIIIAQLTGEGCGSGDWMGWEQWDNLVQEEVRRATDPDYDAPERDRQYLQNLVHRIVADNLDDHGIPTGTRTRAKRDSGLASSFYRFAADE